MPYVDEILLYSSPVKAGHFYRVLNPGGFSGVYQHKDQLVEVLEIWVIDKKKEEYAITFRELCSQYDRVISDRGDYTSRLIYSMVSDKYLEIFELDIYTEVLPEDFPLFMYYKFHTQKFNELLVGLSNREGLE